jgi:hypothetical protein
MFQSIETVLMGKCFPLVRMTIVGFSKTIKVSLEVGHSLSCNFNLYILKCISNYLLSIPTVVPIRSTSKIDYQLAR